jgi:hypothetical protein
VGVQWNSISVINFKKAYDSVRREVLCNTVTEFCMPMKLLRLIKMCLNESTVKTTEVKIYLMHFLFRTV